MNLSCEDKSQMVVLLVQFRPAHFYTNFPFLCSRGDECALKLFEGVRGGNLAKRLEHCMGLQFGGLEFNYGPP